MGGGRGEGEERGGQMLSVPSVPVSQCPSVPDYPAPRFLRKVIMSCGHYIVGTGAPSI